MGDGNAAMTQHDDTNVFDGHGDHRLLFEAGRHIGLLDFGQADAQLPVAHAQVGRIAKM